jgi:hypothetical protein
MKRIALTGLAFWVAFVFVGCRTSIEDQVYNVRYNNNCSAFLPYGCKYYFSSERKFISYEGRKITLRRLIYVASGEQGGWIESFSNLSQTGRCRVLGEAQVYGNAVVLEGAQVKGQAVVRDNALVYGKAVVTSSVVEKDARVYGKVIVENESYITGEACGKQIISGKKIMPMPDVASAVQDIENSK